MKRDSRLWNDYEIEYLRENFTKGKQNASEIAEVLGRTPRAISGKAHKLNIKWLSAIEIPEGYVRCPDCRGIFPEDCFPSNKSKANKRGSYCSMCSNKRRLAYEQKYKEAYKENGPVLEKECPACKEVKPLEEFWKNINRPDGRARLCKKCSIQYERNLRASKKE